MEFDTCRDLISGWNNSDHRNLDDLLTKTVKKYVSDLGEISASKREAIEHAQK